MTTRILSSFERLPPHRGMSLCWQSDFKSWVKSWWKRRWRKNAEVGVQAWEGKKLLSGWSNFWWNVNHSRLRWTVSCLSSDFKFIWVQWTSSCAICFDCNVFRSKPTLLLNLTFNLPSNVDFSKLFLILFKNF